MIKTMLKNKIDRYKRQVIVKEVGVRGQQKLKESKALIIGAGGLGSNTANILTRTGLGGVIIVDYDKVDITNLHRTSIFTENDIGKPKSTILAENLHLINNQVEIHSEQVRVTKTSINKLIVKYNPDIIIDGSDNMATRYIINTASVEYNKPWVYGGVHGTTGMILGVIPGRTACLGCFSSVLHSRSKTVTPVIGYLPVITAAVQSSEAIRLLLGYKPSGLIIYDTWSQNLDKIKIKQNPACIYCSKKRKQRV